MKPERFVEKYGGYEIFELNKLISANPTDVIKIYIIARDPETNQEVSRRTQITDVRKDIDDLIARSAQKSNERVGRVP